MLGITEMMDCFAEHYGKKYAPNTRETVRRQSIHQFEQAGIVESNPDDPARPINSPHWCYQITEEAFELLRRYRAGDWDERLKTFLLKAGSLRQAYARQRLIARIPLTVADGQVLSLSPGKHN